VVSDTYQPPEPNGFRSAYVAIGQKLADGVSMAAMTLLCVYVVLVTFNVMMRYLFKAPMGWISDMGFVFMPMAMAPCLGVAAARGMLVSLTFLEKLLPARGRVMLTVATRIVSATVLAVIGWKMVGYGLSALAEGRSTIQTGIPLGPVWLFAAAGFVLAVPLVFARPVTATPGAHHG